MGVLDLPFSLLVEVFQRYLSEEHIDQVLTHGKTVRFTKSILWKIISGNHVISND